LSTNIFLLAFSYGGLEIEKDLYLCITNANEYQIKW